MSISGRCSSSVMRMTLASSFSGSLATSGTTFSSALPTRYLTIFLSIFMALISMLLRRGVGLELAVVAFLQRIEEIRGGVLLAVVFDLLVASHFDFRAVLQREYVLGVLEVVFLHQHALEGLGVEPERGAALQPLLVGVHVDVLEVLVLVVCGHIRRLGDRGVHPDLRRGLDVHMLRGRHVIGGGEVLRQLALAFGGIGHGVVVDQLAVCQQLEREDVDLLLRLAPFADHIAEVVMRERGLYAVGGIVRE